MDYQQKLKMIIESFAQHCRENGKIAHDLHVKKIERWVGPGLDPDSGPSPIPTDQYRVDYTANAREIAESLCGKDTTPETLLRPLEFAAIDKWTVRISPREPSATEPKSRGG